MQQYQHLAYMGKQHVLLLQLKSQLLLTYKALMAMGGMEVVVPLAHRGGYVTFINNG